MTLTIVSALVLIAGLFLAAIFPRVFGFFAWEIGGQKPDERNSRYHARRGHFWLKVACLSAVVEYGLLDVVGVGRSDYFAIAVRHLGPPMVLALFITSVVAYITSLVYRVGEGSS